jgi:1-acyl-sn-glycerol-3-phosphate acyltransferase
MKKLFYYFVKYIMIFTTRCYFREIYIYGLENIPKEGGILVFTPIIRGAFLDPLSGRV